MARPKKKISAGEKVIMARKLLAEAKQEGIDAELEDDREIERDIQNYADRLAREPHYMIRVQRMGFDDKEDTAFVGAAGVNFEIEKGIEVPVPKSVLEILDHAVVDGTVAILDEVTQRKYPKRVHYLRYPYTSRPCSMEEVVAWRRSHQKNDDAPAPAPPEETFVPAYATQVEYRPA